MASDKDGPAPPPLSPELVSMRFQGLAEDVAESRGWRMREGRVREGSSRHKGSYSEVAE